MRLISRKMGGCGLAGLLLLGSPVRGQDSGAIRQFELEGSIRDWLVLGPMPLAEDADPFQDAGGEAKLTGQGARTVELNGETHVWRWANDRRTSIPPLMDETGKPRKGQALYFYTTLRSPRDQAVSLTLTSEDSVRLYWNGEETHRWNGPRPRFGPTAGDRVEVALRKGVNHLLVRADNQTRTGALRVGVETPARQTPLDLVSALELPGETVRLPPEPAQTWAELVETIPPVPEAPNQAFFGGRIPRTMSLLETSHLTGRPVRISFYGQSIVCQQWTDHVILRLRERYPRAIIQDEKRAIPGYQVPELMITIRHDIFRARPDLVLFHAYGGNEGHRDRLIQAIRRETTAEIMLYTHHIAGRDMNSDEGMASFDHSAAHIRRLAQTYNCELVEAREAWKGYLETHPDLGHMHFLGDGLHLNRNGCVLLAQFVERHFRNNTLFPITASDSVRYYDCLLPVEDENYGEILLDGESWQGKRTHVSSNSSEDRMSLRFVGNRADVILPSGGGGAQVLIDGRPPSELNLYHISRPQAQAEGWGPSMTLRRVWGGDHLVPEEWTLTFTELEFAEVQTRTGASQKRIRSYRYTVEGSVTGPDGEGTHEAPFVSNSGRMKIRPGDFSLNLKHAEKQLKPGLQITWTVRPTHRDVVFNNAATPINRYVTVADGLPFGEHELTLIPLADGWFNIKGVEVHRPELGRPETRKISP